ncbi:MAG: TonB-dependent receptor plug domain-containing protein [Deltaproteobacteria bacterium]|nr:TonB-dependent receptor plug domain-containing protein [Deltaproteobacteria bacterium]
MFLAREYFSLLVRSSVVCALVLVFFCGSASARSLDGTVREAGTRRVIPGAVVTLIVDEEVRKRLPVTEDEFGLPSDGTEQWTDEEGSFHLELPSNLDALPLLTLRVEASGYNQREVEIENDVSRSLARTLYLERGDDEAGTVIRERRSAANRARGSHRIDNNEVNEMPGTYSDPAKAIENFPGMGRVLRSQGSLLVRGADPDESAVYVDDFEVPDLYHFTGSTSVINIPFVESVELVPGAFSARFGRATGGLLRLRTRKLPTDDVHGFAKLDIIDGGVYVGVPLSKNAAVGASARRSWIDVLRGAQVLTGNANDDVTLVPTYWDYQLKLDWDVAQGHELTAFVFGSGDRELYIRPGSENTSAFRRIKDSDFHRVSLRYRHLVGSGFKNAFTIASGWAHHVEDQDYGVYFFERNSFDVQVRDELTYRTGSTRITLGLDATARADDLIFGGGNVDDFNRALPVIDLQGSGRARRRNDLEFRLTTALYSEGEFSPIKGLLLTPGLRLDGYFLNGKPDLSIEPRFAGSYQLLTGEYGLLLKAAGGVFSRPPSAEEMSIARAYGDELSLSHAYHLQAGAEQLLGPGSSLSITLFSVFRSQQTEKAPNFPAADTFGETPVVSTGAGNSVGAEFLLRTSRSRRYFAWIAYAISKHTKFDGVGANAVPYAYPSDFDTTHLLTLVGQVHLWWGFRVGARTRIASGMPNTEVVGGVFDADSGRYRPLTGAKNADRFPPFLALDLRIDWSTVLPWFELDVYADLVNALNIRPQEGWLYNFDYSQREALLGLPLIPSVGFKATF